MKKLFLFVALICVGAIAAAQVPNAIGARLYGGGDFSGAEISFQKGLNDRNRIELDGSFGFKSDNNRIALLAMYHWRFGLPGRFSWFIGPGISLSYDNFNDNSYVNVGVGGQIGIEYNFKDFPFMVSLDARPMWDFLGEVNGLGWGAALGLRYTW